MNDLNIRQYLKTFPANEEIYFCPNPGNAGDSIIAQATLQLFNETGLNYHLIPWKKLANFKLDGKVLMFGGGGNLVGYYKQGRIVIGKYHRRVKKLVILPHTIKGNEDLLGELGDNVDIITREMVSYEHVRKNNSRSNVMLMDDLALSLNVEEVLSEKPAGLAGCLLLKILAKTRNSEDGDSIPSTSRIFSNNIMGARNTIRRLLNRSGYHVLNCFRTGVEATDVSLPADNLDLSRIFAYGTQNEELILYASYRLLRFINLYQEIRTNRLHLCIAGALLGKRVRFYPNSYWKCEAIYDHSIKNRFQNVKWCGEPAR